MSFGIAVIGLGRWGPNYVRIFDAMQDVDLIAVADSDQARLDRISGMYPGVRCCSSLEQVLSDDAVDAIVIAIPTAAHHGVVKQALEAGVHVLCEKPLTNSGKDAWELVALAEKGSQDRTIERQDDCDGSEHESTNHPINKSSNLTLMTGHIFLFNAGIQYLCEAAREEGTGAPYYVNAVRTNLGPFRSDVNAAWDLASHDIYVFNHLLGQRPEAVSAVGASYLRQPVEDIAFLTMRYPGGVLGHVHISWLDPKKVRQLTLVTENKMITWDEFGEPGPIMIHDRSVVKEPTYDTFDEFKLLTHEGDVSVPQIQASEPLSAQAAEFVKRCKGESTGDPRGTAKQGAEVVDILEAASKSLASDGAFVPVTYGG